MIEDGLPDEYTDPKKAVNDARRVAYKNRNEQQSCSFLVKDLNFKGFAFGIYFGDKYEEQLKLKGFTSEDPAEQEENKQE